VSEPGEVGVGVLQALGEAAADGGPLMWPLAALGVALALAGLVFLVLTLISGTRALTFASVLLSGATLALVLGFAGEALAYRQTVARYFEQLSTSSGSREAELTPEEGALILLGTRSDALGARVWGLDAALAPSFLGCVLLGLGVGRLGRFKRP
jgi:hypothetical protein